MSLFKVYKVNKLSSQSDSYMAMERKGVRESLTEIMLSNPSTNPETINKTFAEALTAEKAIVVGKKVQFVKDNATRLDAAKHISKGYGFGSDNSTTIKDNEQINININNNELNIVIDRLDHITKTLDLVPKERSGEI